MIRIKRTIEVDMSAEGIAARLALLEKLYALSLSLGEARLLGSVEELRAGGKRSDRPAPTDRDSTAAS